MCPAAQLPFSDSCDAKPAQSEAKCSADSNTADQDLRWPVLTRVPLTYVNALRSSRFFARLRPTWWTGTQRTQSRRKGRQEYIEVNHWIKAILCDPKKSNLMSLRFTSAQAAYQILPMCCSFLLWPIRGSE